MRCSANAPGQAKMTMKWLEIEMAMATLRSNVTMIMPLPGAPGASQHEVPELFVVTLC